MSIHTQQLAFFTPLLHLKGEMHVMLSDSFQFPPYVPIKSNSPQLLVALVFVIRTTPLLQHLWTFYIFCLFLYPSISLSWWMSENMSKRHLAALVVLDHSSERHFQYFYIPPLLSLLQLSSLIHKNRHTVEHNINLGLMSAFHNAEK